MKKKEIKSKFLEYGINDYKTILKILLKEYHLNNYKITSIKNEDNQIEIFLTNENSEIYFIEFIFDDRLSIRVRRLYYQFCDYYEIRDDEIIFLKSIYKNSHTNTTIEKIQMKNISLDNYEVYDEIVKTNIDGITYNVIEYQFKNLYLDSKIKLMIPSNLKISDYAFIEKLLRDNAEIKSTEDLFKCIISSINYDDIIIKIKTRKVTNTKEVSKEVYDGNISQSEQNITIERFGYVPYCLASREEKGKVLKKGEK